MSVEFYDYCRILYCSEEICNAWKIFGFANYEHMSYKLFHDDAKINGIYLEEVNCKCTPCSIHLIKVYHG